MIDKSQVKYISDLARLEFSEEELEDFTNQFNRILTYMEKINSVDTNDIEPTSHVIPIMNVVRKDQPEPSLTRDDIIAMAPKLKDDFFVVPKIIKESQKDNNGK